MLMTTTDVRTEYEVKGMVKGTSIKAKHLGKDIVAFLRMLVGGKVVEYAELLDSAREEALQEMTNQAEAMGANAIIGVRFSTSQIAQGVAEIIVYGTAVKI
ncbi:MAG: YbjQ family protein [Bacillota bacterium]|nr:YbjQ family protein [Bacillota bacterium]